MATLFDTLFFIFLTACALRGLYRGLGYEIQRTAIIITSAVLAYHFSMPLYYTLQIYINSEKISIAIASLCVFYLSFKIITAIKNNILLNPTSQTNKDTESSNTPQLLFLISFIVSKTTASILGCINGYTLAMLVFFCTQLAGINDLMPTIKNSASGTLLTYGANHLMKRLPDIYCTTKNEAKKAEADNKHNTQRDRALSSNQSHNADDINLDIVIKKMRDLLSDAQRKNLRLIIDKLPRAKILALYQQYQHSPQDFYNTILQQSQIQLKPQEPKPPEPTIDPVAVKVVEKDQSQQNILPQIAGDEKLDMLIEKVAAVKSPEESEKQSTAESGTEVENSAESAEKVNIPAKQ